MAELAALNSGMSARERNRAKRKAKMAARKSSRNKEEKDERLAWRLWSPCLHMYVCVCLYFSW